MTHVEMQELIPLYAVDALPEEEDVELRLHLDACPVCSRMLQEHLETAGALAMTAEPVAPPAKLKESILAQAGRARPEAAPRQRWPRSHRWRLPAVAAAASLAFAGLLTAVALRLNTENAELRQQRQVLALAGSSQVKAVTLTSAPDSPAASGRLFVDPERQRSGLILTGLSDPGDDVYALWLIERGKPRLIENFSPDDSGRAVILIPVSVEGSRSVAVTLEDRPRTAAPAGPAVLKL